MKPTEILKEEHRVIERVMVALERGVNRLSRGEEVYLRFFYGTAFFFKGFEDGCHHGKEERVLFPALRGNGFSEGSSVVAVMLAEHAEGRQLAQMMRLALERFQAGDERYRAAVIKHALEYVRLLRQHIQKEDSLLFPIVDQHIPSPHQELLLDGFRQFDHDASGDGVHEKYFEMAARLETEWLR